MSAAGKKIPSSKPSSIHSVEPSQTVPLAIAPEKAEEPREETAPKEAPSVSSEAPSNPAEMAPVAPDPQPEPGPGPDAGPVAEPVVTEIRPAEEQKPAEQSYEPAYVQPQLSETSSVDRSQESRPEPEPRQEQEQEQQLQDQGINIPISDSPKSISASLPSQDIEHHELTASGASTPGSSSEMTRGRKPLSLNTSQENLHTELSPILEDERSALEEQKMMPFAQPNGMASSNLRAPPINAPTLSQTTSGGTTPRAMPVPVVAVEPPVGEDKGKAKDVSGPTVDSLEHLPEADGYFSRSAPMPVPQVSQEQCVLLSLLCTRCATHFIQPRTR